MLHISGSDAAGTFVEIGENVAANIKIGDRVVAHPNLTCRYATNVPPEGNMTV
jgi:threonine dehydrogenase-like Zn-dependent dehydrogenase